MSTAQELFRRLPSMNEILAAPAVQALIQRQQLDRELAREAATHVLDALREAITDGELDEAALAQRLGTVDAAVERALDRLLNPRLRRVVNGTGVVVHTNLGRAPWPAVAGQRITELAGAYVNLEYDLEDGARGGRDRPVGDFFERLFPGHDVAVVNNNAAAVLLVLNTFAQGREVVVSRGQLVEIGGSFRIPDVMEKGFCELREVGTTNRTRAADFEAAIGPRTGLLLAVHPSNYRVVGFTEEVELGELVGIGAAAGVPVVEDLGSGSIVDLGRFGIDGEPTLGERLAAGVDLVTFSGDKLLGGPQAGFIAGKPAAVERVRRNPLYRALRLDKSALLALEATLREYVAGRTTAIPVLEMLGRSSDELQRRAAALAGRLGEVLGPAGVVAEVIEVESRVGGGAAPGAELPSWAVALTSSLRAEEVMRRLRSTTPAVVGRIVEDRPVFDLRTLLDGDDARIEDALRQAFGA